MSENSIPTTAQLIRPHRSPAHGTDRSPSFRMPGIAHEGIAQLSLLETALWPLQGGLRPSSSFVTEYGYTAPLGRKTAHVTMRAPLGLGTNDELVLWGLLGATLARPDASPVLLATPYWMLNHLGLHTGGSQYTELRESLLRLAVASYQNDGFYNPESKEHEFAAFQFLSLLLPTVGGAGETVDNDRCWRIEWNPAFFRFCRKTGGTLLFDLDLYRALTPAARRLFLKLKDRFWRTKRVFFNVDDLTIHGLGFSADRPQRKRKADLLACIVQLLDHQVLCLGRGQTDPKDLFIKRGKGSYVVSCFEGEYFRQPPAEPVSVPKKAITDDPLYEPLRRIGVDGPAIARLLRNHSRGRIQQWVRLTDAAANEQPRGFTGFRISPAAFLIDGVQQNRTPPDWSYAHEKAQEKKQWERERCAASPEDQEARRAYDDARAAALNAYLNSPEGRQKYEDAYTPLVALYRVTEPDRAHEAAREAAQARVEKLDFHFPDFAAWVAHRLGESIDS
jgi:hypothetical protein